MPLPQIIALLRETLGLDVASVGVAAKTLKNRARRVLERTK
jgi:hypothetical protein